MKRVMIFIILFISLGLAIPIFYQNDSEQKMNLYNKWTNLVRIAGHGLDADRIDSIIQSVQETYVFGIEVDNDITGRYNSFLDPAVKLTDIKKMAEAANAIGNHAFVYIAGLECITDNADEKEHTFFNDHPDWVQRKRDGRPAVFGGGTAFWIREGDEDVWISPYAMEWRKKYMQRIREIAATGIDGVYVDIPYWMTHFEGWEDTWASFDIHTVRAFKDKTGIDARTEIDPGNFNDSGFIQWLNFRIQTITDFMREIDQNVKFVNPECVTIAEIYPGLGEEVVRVGSDVYQLYEVVDAVGHEYSEGAYMASDRDPLDWFKYMIGMYTFRAFAGKKPSWMLSYSWDGNSKVESTDAMELLFNSQLMAGANSWDARGHVMSGSNNYEKRKEIFTWIKKHQEIFYQSRLPIKPVGVYFSPVTRNYFADEFLKSYFGIMLLLMHSHIEFDIITPRTIDQFTGSVLIMPDVKCLDRKEFLTIKAKMNNGLDVIGTGKTAWYDHLRKKYKKNMLDSLKSSTKLPDTRLILVEECPGKIYYNLMEQHFNSACLSGTFEDSKLGSFRTEFYLKHVKSGNLENGIKINAPPSLAIQIKKVQSRPHIFMANFKGIKGGEQIVPVAERDIVIEIEQNTFNMMFFLPFLGKIQQIAVTDNVIHLPAIETGAVVWFE